MCTAGTRQISNKNLPFVWLPNVNTSLPIGYYPWVVGQPKQGDIVVCLHMVQVKSYRWDDFYCDLEDCVLCEYGPY